MDDIAYRRAGPADICALVDLRAAFLAEVAGSDPRDTALLDAMRRYFTAAVGNGEFVGFLALAGNQVVASSGLVYHRHPPSPRNMQGIEAYIMNMYTLPVWRGRGIATALLRELIGVARQSNCCRVRLDALPTAEPLYRRAGFVEVEGQMQRDL